jgi:translation initiation factor 5
MINIPSYIEDPAYRYKMARIVHKIEGKGNGIKTNLVNLVEIARDLRVRSEYPLKFMGYEKGSQTKYTVNKNEVQSIINGAF